MTLEKQKVGEGSEHCHNVSLSLGDSLKLKAIYLNTDHCVGSSIWTQDIGSDKEKDGGSSGHSQSSSSVQLVLLIRGQRLVLQIIIISAS